uniref:Uncharacterized protein n=1 Tax=Kwoniella pini CBS 10737 TaxID=1296096 RepID=A0A1B9IBP9_9TREE|nr:uncharacterized protein I206_00376 [Kwoniella pini CBS 10737]OCF53075.1 hypothetical protein I206_00376 [Kwoniella pini CBS 10737]
MFRFVILSILYNITAIGAQSKTYNGFEVPSANNGSMLTYTLNTFPPNLGEPLNVIISNQSDPRVLIETMWEGGLYNYLEAAAFGGQCLGLQMGDEQQSNLGDGNKNQTQKSLLRYQYFHNQFLGTCLETLYGGNHIRVFKQETSGAFFLSSSTEEDSTRNHALGLNAYDNGRDFFIGNATNVVIEGHPDTNTTFTGEISKRGWKYRTTVNYVDDLVPANKSRWNHYVGVQAIGGGVSDGLVAVLTVQVARDDPVNWGQWVWSILGL